MKKQRIRIDDTEGNTEKYWVGRDKNYRPPKLKKQSKYDTDMLSLPENVIMQEDGDYRYNRWDLDEPETNQ